MNNELDEYIRATVAGYTWSVFIVGVCVLMLFLAINI